MMYKSLLVFPILCTFAFATSLPENRLSCRENKLMYIPDENDYFEEAVEMSFNSDLTYNHIPINQIVAEECDLRDSDFLFGSHRRLKRSAIAKGIHHLSKLVRYLLQKGKTFLSPHLLKRLSAALKKAAIAKTLDKSYDFWLSLWKNPEKVRRETNDENLGEMLESALRGSLQMLRQEGQLSEMMIHHPNILEKIKRRLPLGNSLLLSQITALNVECYSSHRDSQIVIFLKLRIPKVREVTVEQCDDIGMIEGRSYRYYALPNMTFSRKGETVQVHTEHCKMEDFLYCPTSSIEKVMCTRNSVEHCEKKGDIHPRNFSRQLVRGFAVFGDFRQIISKEGDTYSQVSVKPRRLHHLVPKRGQTLIVGDQEFEQDNGGDVATVVREV